MSTQSLRTLTAVVLCVGLWNCGGTEQPAETAGGGQPGATTPAPPTSQPAPPAAAEVPLSEATLRGSASDPAYQKPEVATDPSFKEAVGQILPGVPAVPGYPSATLVGSAEQNRPGESVQGYRLKWTTPADVATVMAWYRQNLPAHGWTFKMTDDDTPEVEQLATISKGDFEGYVAAEAAKGLTEIVVSLKKTSRQ